MVEKKKVKMEDLRRGDSFAFSLDEDGGCSVPWVVVDAVLGLACSPHEGGFVADFGFLAGLFGARPMPKQSFAVISREKSPETLEVILLDSAADAPFKKKAEVVPA